MERVSYEAFIDILKSFMGEYLDTLTDEDDDGYGSS
jgi:hypothetical protein